MNLYNKRYKQLGKCWNRMKETSKNLTTKNEVEAVLN